MRGRGGGRSATRRQIFTISTSSASISPRDRTRSTQIHRSSELETRNTSTIRNASCVGKKRTRQNRSNAKNENESNRQPLTIQIYSYEHEPELKPEKKNSKAKTKRHIPKVMTKGSKSNSPRSSPRTGLDRSHGTRKSLHDAEDSFSPTGNCIQSLRTRGRRPRKKRGTPCFISELDLPLDL